MDDFGPHDIDPVNGPFGTNPKRGKPNLKYTALVLILVGLILLMLTLLR